MGALAQMGRLAPLQRWKPSTGIFHASRSEYSYENGQHVAKVKIGWSARESGDSCISGTVENLRRNPHGLVVVYNGQASVLLERLNTSPRGVSECNVLTVL